MTNANITVKEICGLYDVDNIESIVVTVYGNNNKEVFFYNKVGSIPREILKLVVDSFHMSESYNSDVMSGLIFYINAKAADLNETTI